MVQLGESMGERMNESPEIYCGHSVRHSRQLSPPDSCGGSREGVVTRVLLRNSKGAFITQFLNSLIRFRCSANPPPDLKIINSNCNNKITPTSARSDCAHSREEKRWQSDSQKPPPHPSKPSCVSLLTSPLITLSTLNTDHETFLRA